MSTKICPNCNAEVASVANLCKHCFHDFHTPVVKKKSPWWTLLFLACGTAIVSAMAFGYMADQKKVFNITIDQETQSIVFTTRYADRTEAERVYFKDISSIEYKMNARPRPFEVDVVTVRGDRFVYQQSSDPIEFEARQLSEITGKPYLTKDEYIAPDVLKKKQ